MSSRRFRRALTAVLVLVLAITVPVSGAIAKVVPPEGFYTASRIDLLGHVGSSVNGTFVDGDRLYVAGAIGLEVYDITTPLSPVKLGECLIATGQPSQVVADASHAYVLTSSAAVVAIDVGDPTEPTAVGTLLAVTGSPQTHDGLALSGSTVFVAGYNEIVPVDVTDPEAMTAGVAFLTGDLGGSWYIDVDGDRLAAVSGANVALVDIATPSAPIVLSVTPFTDLNPGGVDLVWPHLFLGSFNSAVYGLSAFDFSSGAAVLVDSYTNGSWYFESVAVDGGGIAHASFYDGSIITLDVTDPSDIAYESHLDFQTSGNPSDMAIDDSGSVAYIGDSSRGLFTFDVSTPTAITQGPVFRALRSAADVVVSGGMAFVADQTYGVQVFDVTDLADPLFVTGVPLPYASGLAIVGDLLLVNRSPGGGQFSVLDITNPAAPAVTDSLAIPSSSYSDDVAGSEDRAYVVAGGTLKVIDISDPSDISEVGSWSGTFEYSALDVVGTVAVVGATSGSVELLDISADTPVSVGGGVGAWDMVNEVLIDGDVCYVATNGTAGGYGLLQLPISEWGLGGIQYYGFPSQYVTITDMAITEDGYLCMGGPDGIKVFDLPITMTGPPVVASYAPLFNGRGLALNGDGIVTTTLYDGLFTFNGPDFTGPSITVTGVSDGGSYDGPVTPSVTFGADAIDSSVELDGSAWTPATISDPGAYLLEAWAEDHWGNSATDAKEFVILTGPEARLAGTDRYATSAQISESTFKSASTVVLATGRNFPDALAAAPLAYQLDGPVLLVNEGVVPDAILDEIERLGATSAYIVGGTTAVPDSVKAQLVTAGIPLANIERIAGSNRYDTARMIAEELREIVGSPLSKAYIATGEAFPDALAAGGLAARQGAPVLLVRTTGVPAETLSAIDSCGVTATTVLGGALAIPDAVLADLPKPTRLSGPDRYETCRLIAEASLAAGFSDEAVYLAIGANFPDALSAGAASAARGIPVLLVRDPLPAPAITYATDHAGVLWEVIPVGGTVVVPESVVTAFKDVLTD